MEGSGISVPGSLGPVELTAEDFDRLMGVAPGDATAGCGHPGYPIELRCGACVRQERAARYSAETGMMLVRANPLIFAPELIEQATGRGLTASELAEVRQGPARALRGAGLGELL